MTGLKRNLPKALSLREVFDVYLQNCYEIGKIGFLLHSISIFFIFIYLSTMLFKVPFFILQDVMHLNFLDIISIVTAFQLLFLTLYLVTYRKGDRTSTRILLAFLFVNAVIVIKFFMFHSGLAPYRLYPPIHAINSGLYLVLAQVLYFYTRMLGTQEVRWKWTYGFHGIPFFFIILHALLTYYFFPTFFSSRSVILFRYIFVHGLLFGYIIATFFVVCGYRKDLKEHFSSSKHVNVAWLNLLLAAFSLMWLVDVVIIAMLMSGFRAELWSDLLTAISLLINLYFATCLVYRGLKQPNLFTGIEVVLRSKPSELPKQQAKRYLDKLQDVMLSEKPYLEPMLTIHDLAEKTSIPVRHLSRVINESLKQNFFDFISDYRIDEAKRRLADPANDHQTVLRILYDVGFNSKSSFNLLFKQKTGFTPTEFKHNTKRSASDS